MTEVNQNLRPPAGRARRDGLLAGLCGLLALALYLRTLAPGVLAGDSGEFQFAAWLDSLPHPTGYPLYMSLGYLWTHLWPWGDPAYRMNLLSALLAACAAGLVALLALEVLRRAWPARLPAGAQYLLAFAAAATFAVTPTFWSQAVIAEVYALHAAFVAGILWALLAWAAPPPALRRDRYLYLAAALCGLSLAHHRATLLLLPSLALFLLPLALGERAGRAWLRRAARALPLLLAPLLLYLLIPWRAAHTPYAQLDLGSALRLVLYVPTPAGFWSYITGQVFAQALRDVPSALALVAPATALQLHEIAAPGAILAGLGLLWLVRRRSWALLTLTATAFLAVEVFNLFYGIGDIFVYYIPAYLIATLWMALGLAAGAGLLARFLPASGAQGLWTRSRLLSAVCCLALLLPGWLLVAGYSRVDQSHNDEAARTGRALLALPLPPDTVLVTNDRDEMMPLWYYRYVAGVRPDVLGLFPLIVPGAAWADVAQVAEQAWRSGRPVYLTKVMPGLEIKLALDTGGPLPRVLGPAVAGPPLQPASQDFGGLLRLAGYDAPPAPPAAGATIAIALYWQPMQPLAADYTTFIQLRNAEGRVIGQSDHQVGGVYYPSHLWRAGDLLKDTHVLRLAPEGLGPGPYILLAGLYTHDGDRLEHLGRPAEIGHLP